jgi:hypothetical protein
LTKTIDRTDIQFSESLAHACEGRFRGRGVEGSLKAET